MELITKTILLFLVSCIAITLQNTQSINIDADGNPIVPVRNSNAIRDKRATIYKRKTGPIRQIFGLIYDQWNDTRVTWNTINTMLNDNFLPENAPTTTTTTPNPNLNISTKPPPFRITRTELARILRRNLKGIKRLYNIEWADAMKQSAITQREFKKNVSREISKFL